MATVTIPDEKKTLTQVAEVRDYLAGIGITYERWEPSHELPAGASAVEVIDVSPATPGLEAMLNRFNSEHWHDEDEVRFIIEGRGLFHIHPREGEVVSITVEAGDLLRVPRGTWHWFDLCQERRIRAIRLFQDASGWTPHYTGSGTDRRYDPVCFGPSYIAGRDAIS